MIMTAPTKGTLSQAQGVWFPLSTTVTYEPTAFYNGADSFTYVMNDGQANSTVATVRIRVNAIDNEPVAIDSALEMEVQQTRTMQLEATDVDTSRQDLRFFLVGRSQFGNVKMDDAFAGVLTYDAVAPGVETIKWQVTDGTYFVDGKTVITVGRLWLREMHASFTVRMVTLVSHCRGPERLVHHRSAESPSNGSRNCRRDRRLLHWRSSCSIRSVPLHCCKAIPEAGMLPLIPIVMRMPLIHVNTTISGNWSSRAHRRLKTHCTRRTAKSSSILCLKRPTGRLTRSSRYLLLHLFLQRSSMRSRSGSIVAVENDSLCCLE